MATELLRALWRPTELVAMLRVKKQQKTIVDAVEVTDEDLGFCYRILKEVSRSFAAVIMQLNGEVRDAVCIFYLVLRALDTVEDDMSLDPAIKVPELRKFHEHLEDITWSYHEAGEGCERELLENYPKVARIYAQLSPHFQRIIKQICRRMGNGMADFVERSTVEKKSDYDLYCHYVAGLVGIGVTQLWEAAKLESPSAHRNDRTSNEMGLFLQKTNIIRDYLEDIVEDPPRIFWPEEIWKEFTDDLHSFKLSDNQGPAVRCLNRLVLDCLQHMIVSLEYISSLKEPSVITFCAIPQVMAVATLTELYGNPNVFKGVVKIRKGEACKIILGCDNLPNIINLYHEYVQKLLAKLNPADGSYAATKAKLEEILTLLTNEYGAGSVDTTITRSVITTYTVLGGQLLYSIVDTLTSLFNRAAIGSPNAPTPQNAPSFYK